MLSVITGSAVRLGRNAHEWQAALPEAAEYLKGRRIPLELVRELCGGVGTFGGTRRLVLPHTDPAGRIVSLYGRRIDGADDHTNTTTYRAALKDS
jgi:hypothetical protein